MQNKEAAFGNPVIRHLYTADPTVIDYQGKVYCYTGHDEPPTGVDDYVMKDWHCFSSDNLTDWEDHGALLKATDFTWASGDAYASKVIEYNNRFYWFVAVTHATIAGKAIGIAVADHPAGPFADAKGLALITQDMVPDPHIEKVNLDPTVLIDDDGAAYIYWGNTVCYYARLSADLLSIDGPIQRVSLPGFTEGAHGHKANGWYYLSYGYGYPEKVAYAMSRHPEGPWEYKGILNEIAGNCATNRPAIIEFKGQSYFFYHNGALPEGGSHRRSVCIDYLYYFEDDTMKRVAMTTEGVEEVL